MTTAERVMQQKKQLQKTIELQKKELAGMADKAEAERKKKEEEKKKKDAEKEEERKKKEEERKRKEAEKEEEKRIAEEEKLKEEKVQFTRIRFVCFCFVFLLIEKGCASV